MAYCGKCGAQYQEGTKFCPSCGAPLSQAQAQRPQQSGNQNNYEERLRQLNNTADRTSQYSKADIEQNKIMAILAYLSYLVLIPLFAAKESKFARFHVNQGLVLVITETLWWVVTGVLTNIFYAISFGLGTLVSAIAGLANIVFFILLIIGIANAANGLAKELPVIGKFRILK